MANQHGAFPRRRNNLRTAIVVVGVAALLALPTLANAHTYTPAYEFANAGVTRDDGIGSGSAWADRNTGKMGALVDAGGVYGATSANTMVGGKFRTNTGSTLSSIYGYVNIDLHVRGTISCINAGGLVTGYAELFLRIQDGNTIVGRPSFKKYDCGLQNDINEDLQQSFMLKFYAGKEYRILVEMVTHAEVQGVASASVNFGGNGREIEVRSIEVSNLPPRIKAPDVSVKYANQVSGGTALTGEACDYDDSIESYRWDFGDGTTFLSSGHDSSCVSTNARHTYTLPGVYAARVCATDNEGSSHCDDVAVTVSPL